MIECPYKGRLKGIAFHRSAVPSGLVLLLPMHPALKRRAILMASPPERPNREKLK